MVGGRGTAVLLGGWFVEGSILFDAELPLAAELVVAGATAELGAFCILLLPDDLGVTLLLIIVVAPLFNTGDRGG
jgi:hypothetical protein